MKRIGFSARRQLAASSSHGYASMLLACQMGQLHCYRALTADKKLGYNNCLLYGMYSTLF